MPLDNPRIEELRRRVQADPASIAFAQLAEEYRRSGSYDEAVKTCRLGLARHPGYLSARVTLSRALIELDALDEAQHELEFVLRAAPENLAAIRGMAEIFHRRGQMPQALEFYRRALEFARHDPELEETVAEIARELGHGPAQARGLSFEEAQSELLSAFERMPAGPSPPPPIPDVPAAVPRPIPDAAPAAPAVDAPHVETAATAAGGDALTDFFADLADAPPAVASTSEAPGEPAPSAAGQAGSAPGDRTFDFDSLLEALGEPQDRPAPAPVEALLGSSGQDAPPVLAAGDIFDLPADASGEDPLASLEQSLRKYSPPKVEATEEPETPDAPAPADAAGRAAASPATAAPSPEAATVAAPPPATPTATPVEESPLSPTQQAIVEDLEQWLDQIVLHRGDSRS